MDEEIFSQKICLSCGSEALRESKTTLDGIVNSKCISGLDARRLITPSVQATGLDTELKIMKLFAPGLYTVRYVGSILILNYVKNLQLSRKTCLPKLNCMKVNWFIEFLSLLLH